MGSAKICNQPRSHSLEDCLGYESIYWDNTSINSCRRVAVLNRLKGLACNGWYPNLDFVEAKRSFSFNFEQAPEIYWMEGEPNVGLSLVPTGIFLELLLIDYELVSYREKFRKIPGWTPGQTDLPIHDLPCIWEFQGPNWRGCHREVPIPWCWEFQVQAKPNCWV